MRILVRPCYDVGLKNYLFEPGDSRADHHKEPWFQWRETARAQGVWIDTWDLYPLSQADLIWVQDLPASKQEIVNAKASAPNALFVLQIYESPVDRLHFHDVRNHIFFDAIVTYNSRLCDEKRYFHYQLPLGVPKKLPVFKPFSERKRLVMVNTNTYSGWLAPRHPKLTGIPVVGPYLGEWQIRWNRVIEQQQLSLYERRRKIARLAEKISPYLLDIYGTGWQGEATSWVHKIVPAAPFKNALGRTTLPKMETLSQYQFCLAFENFAGNYGYISEKIFDCFYAGVVPIYWGDQDITQYVPKAAFIDARNFKDDLELLNYIQNCPESVWQKMYEAGQTYLTSKELEQFQTEAFVSRMLQIIKTVANSSKKMANLGRNQPITH